MALRYYWISLLTQITTTIYMWWSWLYQCTTDLGTSKSKMLTMMTLNSTCCCFTYSTIQPISWIPLKYKKDKRYIWLGPLKDLGLKISVNIWWTGNPVKCLEIYTGHNREWCDMLNWSERISYMKKVKSFLEMVNLTLFSRVYVIKTCIYCQQ